VPGFSGDRRMKLNAAHTSPVDRPSIPQWFVEVVILIQHLAMNGLLDAFAH
jgi:hypothetical protein